MATSSTKVTKAQMFASIMAVPAVAENAEMTTFLQHEIDLVNARNARKSNTPSKKDIENESIMERILAELASAENGMTVSEIGKALGSAYSNQKVSALMKKLADSGKVEKQYEKRVARFFLA